jgi:hypothetical protein
LRHYSCALRSLKYLALTAAVSAVATAGMAVGTIRPAHAEFQIQEADVEKGAVQLSYRGAVHWGVPQATDDNENANDLVQSHEFETQYGLTNWWLFSFTLGTDQPRGEDFNVSSVEFEAQYQFVKRKGDGIALAIQGGYEKAINHGGEQNADEIGFGPIVELASGKLLITFNPLFTDQVGPNRDTDSLGFGYGWRAEYDFAKHWGLGVEMFGEIEDLANAGSFNDHNHSIGPTLFWNPSNDDDEAGQAEGGGDEDKVAGPPPLELSFNVGLQFGLTDATSDTGLKFQGELNF